MRNDRLAFPADFVFGAATAAYQIEGASSEDGKGDSVWDRFARRPGAIKTGETGDRACDHYHRWREDVELMRWMGLDAYRGSVSWPRILPEGRGSVNDRGLDFYSRLVDALLEAGVAPWLTLFHWDLPWALQRDSGGFFRRGIADYFADYVEIVVRALGDRVKHWFTFNEPFEYACFGHALGVQAPGYRRPLRYFKVMHNILLSHGKALERIRSLSPDAKAGIALSYTPLRPASEAPKDREAAFLADQFMNRITFDPILRGRYPEELARRTRLIGPRILPGDLELISRKVDFVGLNYYSRETAARDPWMPFLRFSVTGKDGGRREEDRIVEGGLRRTTAMGWEVWPQGLEDLADLMRVEYGNPPVVISESGAAFSDEPTAIGGGRRVPDQKRVDFLEDYLAALRRAMDKGADARGFFVWSLLDNFEWAEGFRPRFGLVRVDYDSLERTPKDSARWYRDLIAGRSLDLPAAGERTEP
jgi:beta-glucosidase